MSASLELPQLKKKSLPEVTGTTHQGQGQSRKVPFPLPNTSQLCRITLSLETPWTRPDAQLLPLSYLLPPLSHKHWSETILGWTLHADYLNISFRLTTLWHLYSPGPLGLNSLLTLLTASWLYKPRLTKRGNPPSTSISSSLLEDWFILLSISMISLMSRKFLGPSG